MPSTAAIPTPTAASFGASGVMIALGVPVRPIFGTIRYMSSENTEKKLWLAKYLAKYGEQPSLLE
jgi:hypothetical protein